MKNYINSILISILVLILPGCEKNNPAALTGGIIGNVILEDENQYNLMNHSGVKVDIINNENIFTTQTDKNGDFGFSEIPIGKYNLKLTKEGFTDLNNHDYSTGQPVPDHFFHLGGKTPTRLSRGMYQIPDYAFHLDSVLYRPDLFTALLIFGPPPFESVVPRYYYYPMICFFNDTPDVSKDHYLFYNWGFMNFWKQYPEWDPPVMNIEYPWQLANVTQDSVYICVYSVSFAETEYATLRFESLGKPSNVIRFAVR